MFNKQWVSNLLPLDMYRLMFLTATKSAHWSSTLQSHNALCSYQQWPRRPEWTRQASSSRSPAPETRRADRPGPWQRLYVGGETRTPRDWSWDDQKKRKRAEKKHISQLAAARGGVKGRKGINPVYLRRKLLNESHRSCPAHSSYSFGVAKNVVFSMQHAPVGQMRDIVNVTRRQ